MKKSEDVVQKNKETFLIFTEENTKTRKTRALGEERKEMAGQSAQGN